MFTVMFVLHENPVIDLDKAHHHWHTTHADLVRSIPGVRRYVQNSAVRSPDGSAPPFLGVAELAFDDEAAFGEATQSPEFAAAIADLSEFADPDRLPTAVVEPRTAV